VRVLLFQVYFRALVGGLNHSNVRACSSQKPSESFTERSYIASYWAELM
jgi:hypothetical protein